MRVRRLVGALAAAALVGLGTTTPPAAAAPAAAPVAPVPAQADTGVEIRAEDQEYWVTREGTWSLTLSISGAPAGASLTADLYARVDDRDQYTRSILGVLDGDELPPFPDIPLDEAELQPDGSRSVTLAVTLREDPPPDPRPGWRFFSDGLRPGVYPVDINVVDADGASLDRIVAHITRIPSEGDPDPGAGDVLVAPLVTLGSQPTVGPDRRAVPDPVVPEAVGQLAEGLGMTPDLPLTLVPRPESVEALARDEDVEVSLRRLQRIARARQVVDGTYVEVPLGAWIDRGLTDELARQRERGNGILTEQLGRADSSTWDARRGLTPDAAAALWPVGVRTVILSPGALDGGAVTGPVTVAAGPDHDLEAVVPDPDVSGALLRYEDDPVLNAAALAAELALVAVSAEGTRGVVVAPPDGWLDDPVNVGLVGEVLLDPVAPVEAVGLAQLLERVPSAGTRQLRPALQEDLGGYPERLALARARLSSYASLVGAGTGEVGALDQLLLLSGSADIPRTERAAYVEEVLAVTDDRFGSVEAPSRQTVNLTSSDGEIPLTLLNRLDRPVTVTVEIPSTGRIEIGDFPPTQTLQPGTNSLEIPVHARAPGDATIDITVRTTDGEVKIDDVRYTVRSTAVPGIGVVLSVGAVAFLLVWWARHWLQARRARRGGDDGGGGGGDPDPSAPDPDPTPGTAATPTPELVPT